MLEPGIDSSQSKNIGKNLLSKQNSNMDETFEDT